MTSFSKTFQNIRKLLFVLIFLVYGGLLINYWPVLFNAITEKYIAIILIIILSAAYFLIQAFNFFQLLNIKPSLLFYTQTVQLWGLANLTNYLAPFQPGLALRVAHFKSNRIPIVNTAHATIQQLQISYWTGFICLGAVLVFFEITALRIAGMFFFIIAVLWFLLINFTNRIIKYCIILFKLEKYNPDIASYNLSIPSVRILIIFFIQHFIATLAIYITFRSFGNNISLSYSLIIGIIVTLSTLISILPNNLGIQELLLAYSAQLNGVGTGEALSIALVFRIAQIFSSFLILALSSLMIRIIVDKTTDMDFDQ